MDLIKPSENVAEYISDVKGVVEANRYESLALWEKYSQRTKWKSLGFGFIPCIGKFNDHPVHISLLKNYILDQPILFWYATSPIVNYNMIDEWLKEFLPNEAYANKSDADNFFNVVNNLKSIDESS